MRAFKDSTGRTWSIEINVAALKRIRGLAGVDLMQVVEGTGGLIEKLIRDPVLLCDVVYALCKPEADARTPAGLGRRLRQGDGGGCDRSGDDGGLGGTGEFSARARGDRANLGRVLQATQRVMDKAPRPDRKEDPDAHQRRGAGPPREPDRGHVWRFIYQCAGIIGVDPGPLTLRELTIMLEGRQRHDWSVASGLMALVANTQRDPKRSRPLKPSDFDPFAKPNRSPASTAPLKVGVSVLKHVFIEGRLPDVSILQRKDSACG